MKRLCAILLLVLLGASPQPLTSKLWRLDCGQIAVSDLDEFSDTRAYVGRHAVLVASCYLIRHGDEWMLWDTGLPAATGSDLVGNKHDAPAPTLVAHLARLGLKPAQISIIGISHYHYDHVGQAAQFPQARLLIGSRDADAIRADPTLAEPLKPWFSGTSRLDPVTGDRDIFGDGQVVMLDLPGHTPGHHGLLVTLKHKGSILLSGDVSHFRENYNSDGVPSFNTNRSESLASLDRFKKLAKNLRAVVVIQHDPDDVAKLPAFPLGID